MTVRRWCAPTSTDGCSPPPATQRRGSHAVYTDHLGTPRLKLHVMTAAAEARDDYYPFGQQVNTVVDAAHDRRFTGQERDAESGLDYFGARYYHSVAGRFLSVDPVLDSGDPTNPQSWNRYTYTVNNPLIYVDPDGKDIKLAAGLTTQQKLQIVGNLLKLTNDKLVYKTLGDGTAQIKIVSLGTRNSSKTLNFGTNLIRTINTKNPGAKTTFIDFTGRGNRTCPGGLPNAPQDATVKFNLSKTTGGVDVTGGNIRPPEIGLGHELIHAKDVNAGTRNTGLSGQRDPDGSGTILTNEEMNARRDENKLRREHGLALRKIR